MDADDLDRFRRQAAVAGKNRENVSADAAVLLVAACRGFRRTCKASAAAERAQASLDIVDRQSALPLTRLLVKCDSINFSCERGKLDRGKQLGGQISPKGCLAAILPRTSSTSPRFVARFRIVSLGVV